MRFFFLLLVSISIASCQKCKDCTLTSTTTVDGIGDVEEKEIREYCGRDLKDIEDNPSYERNGVSYSWECE